jgi:ribosomal-protein-alanine N-acetyltransferase
MKVQTANEFGARLRPLTENDFTERYLAWFRDPQVTRFLEASNITHEDAIAHLRQGQAGDKWRLYAICRADGLHIGNVKIGPINRRHSYSDLVTVIGDRASWGQGYARNAIRMAMEIAFNELKLRKLSASIDSGNLGSIRAYTAAGFAIEATLLDQFMHEENGRLVLSNKVYVACFNPAFDQTSVVQVHQEREK